MSSGVFAAQNSNGLWGLISTSGKVLVDYKYKNFGRYNGEGYFVFDQHYIYDKAGKLVHTDESAKIYSISQGIILKSKNNDKDIIYQTLDNKTIYSRNGNIYLATGFNNSGNAVISYYDPEIDDSHIIAIDKTGKIVYDSQELTENEFSQFPVIPIGGIGDDGWIPYSSNTDGYYFNNYKNNEKKVIRGDFYIGEVTIKDSYDKNLADVLTVNDFAVAHISGEKFSPNEVVDSLALINIKEAKVILLDYKSLALFENSQYVLAETHGGKKGYLDKTGKELKFYEDATGFENGIAMIKENGSLYFINEKFEKISEAISGDGVSIMGEGNFAIEKNGLYYICKYVNQ